MRVKYEAFDADSAYMFLSNSRAFEMSSWSIIQFHLIRNTPSYTCACFKFEMYYTNCILYIKYHISYFFFSSNKSNYQPTYKVYINCFFFYTYDFMIDLDILIFLLKNIINMKIFASYDIIIKLYYWILINFYAFLIELNI